MEADGGALRGDPLTEGDELVNGRLEMILREEVREGKWVRSRVNRKPGRSELLCGRGRIGRVPGGFDKQNARFLKRLSEGGDSKVGILFWVVYTAREGLQVTVTGNARRSKG